MFDRFCSAAMGASLACASVWLAGCGDKESAACGKACAPLADWTELAVLAGQPGGRGWVDGPGEAVHFLGPYGLAFDGKDHLYMTDDSVIREIDLTANSVRSIAGGPVIGSADGIGDEASFFDPLGIAFAKGALYVCDNENSTLRKIDVDTGMVSTVAGVLNVFGHKDGVGTSAVFGEPEGVVWDSADNVLYVTDTDNHTIRKLDVATRKVTTVAGMPMVGGTQDGVGSEARFSRPTALMLDQTARVLFISDAGNLAIRKMTLADSRVSTVAKLEIESEAMVMDGTDVLTTVGASIARVSVKTGDVTTIAGNSTLTGFIDAVGTSARFGAITAMVADGAGAVLITDLAAHALRKLDPASGEITTLMGASSAGAADGKGKRARFARPQGIVAVGERLYVADTENHAIRSVELATGNVITVAGALGEAGHEDGDGKTARFNRPSGLAFDGDDTLYIAELGNKDLRKLALSSGAVSTLKLAPAHAGGAVTLNAPTGLTFDRGHLYVTDADHIVSVDLEAAQIAVMPQSARAATLIASLAGIVADGHGRLFVADNLKNTVLQIDIETGDVAKYVGAAGLGDDELRYPSQLALAPDGTLLVADSQTLRAVTQDGTEVHTLVGTLERQGVMLGPLPAQLGETTALALTDDGELAIVAENSILVAR